MAGLLPSELCAKLVSLVSSDQDSDLTHTYVAFGGDRVTAERTYTGLSANSLSFYYLV